MSDIEFDFICDSQWHHKPIPKEWDVLANDSIRLCVHCFYQSAFLANYKKSVPELVATSVGDEVGIILDEQDRFPSYWSLLNTPVKTEKDVIMWLLGMKRFGVDFHWDENPHEIVNGRTNKELFTHAEAVYVNNQIDRSIDVLGSHDHMWNLHSSDPGNAYDERKVLALATWGYAFINGQEITYDPQFVNGEWDWSYS